MTPSASAREELRAQIEDANHRYYILDDPAITDAEFDALLRELLDLEDSPSATAHAGIPDATRGRDAVGALCAVRTFSADAELGQRLR